MFEAEGYTMLEAAIDPSTQQQVLSAIVTFMQSTTRGRLQHRRGGVVGGRNLIEQENIWRPVAGAPAVQAFLSESLSDDAHLVRVLYFDKPPGQGWALPLHRDRMIAVQQHHLPPEPFSRPSTKAGVPHVAASDELLSRMVVLRLHLDPMNDENGALYVVPGTHHIDDQAAAQGPPRTIHCRAGDVMAMRPLLLHGSHASVPNTRWHRRILHLEIAPDGHLPSPYRWHTARRLA